MEAHLNLRWWLHQTRQVLLGESGRRSYYGRRDGRTAKVGERSENDLCNGTKTELLLEKQDALDREPVPNQLNTT